MLIAALSQLVGMVCVSATLAVIASTFAAIAGRWFGGEHVTPVVIRGE